MVGAGQSSQAGRPRPATRRMDSLVVVSCGGCVVELGGSHVVDYIDPEISKLRLFSWQQETRGRAASFRSRPLRSHAARRRAARHRLRLQRSQRSVDATCATLQPPGDRRGPPSQIRW